MLKFSWPAFSEEKLMGHLKRSRAPKFWPIKRKGLIWTVKTSPGPHPLRKSLPLLLLVRDVLKLGDTAREAKSIITQGKILVDKKPRKDPKFPLGLMDNLEIPEIKKYSKFVMGTAGLELVDVSPEETLTKLCRINGKTTIKNGLQQLNLHDGRNIIAEGGQYKVGDSVLLDLSDQTIQNHLKFDEGSPVMIIDGKNKGLRGSIKKIHPRKTVVEKTKVIVNLGDKEIETLKDYMIVTGVKGENISPSKKRKIKE